MRKRPQISSSDASRRSKKGWDTRRRKSPVSKKSLRERDAELTREHPFMGAIVGYGTFVAGRRANERRRGFKHQYVWTRPNGETVKVRGYTPKHLETLSPALGKVDHAMKRSIRIASDDLEIRNQRPPIWAVGAGGMSMPGYNSKEARKILKKQTGHNKPTLTDKISSRAFGMHRHDTIYVSPKQGKGGRHWVLQHEIGHAVDKGDEYSSRKVWRKQARWHQSAEAGTGLGGVMKSMTRPETLAGYEGGIYQKVSPSEDFAETFRGGLGHRDGMIYNTPRRDFMRANIWRTDNPHSHVGNANLVRTAGIHNHIDKFIIGGALAGAAGYGYYKYKHDDKFKKNVDEHVQSLRRKVKRG